MIITNAKREDAKTLTELTIRSKNYWGYGHAQIEEWRDEQGPTVIEILFSSIERIHSLLQLIFAFLPMFRR